MQSSQRLPWAAAVACCGKAVEKARTGGPGGIKDLSSRLEREDTRVAAGLTPPKGDAGHAQSERQSYLCRLPHPPPGGARELPVKQRVMDWPGYGQAHPHRPRRFASGVGPPAGSSAPLRPLGAGLKRAARRPFRIWLSCGQT